MQDIPGEPISGRMAQRRDGARHILGLRQPSAGIFVSGGLEDLLKSRNLVQCGRIGHAGRGNSGGRVLYCHIDAHIEAGMMAMYQVQP